MVEEELAKSHLSILMNEKRNVNRFKFGQIEASYSDQWNIGDVDT